MITLYMDDWSIFNQRRNKMHMQDGKIHMECRDKVKYSCEEKANQGLQDMKRQGYVVKKNLRPYECNECDGWHLGHSQF